MSEKTAVLRVADLVVYGQFKDIPPRASRTALAPFVGDAIRSSIEKVGPVEFHFDSETGELELIHLESFQSELGFFDGWRGLQTGIALEKVQELLNSAGVESNIKMDGEVLLAESGAEFWFNERGLFCLSRRYQPTRSKKRQISVSLTDETIEELRRRANQSRTSMSAIAAEWIQAQARSLQRDED